MTMQFVAKFYPGSWDSDAEQARAALEEVKKSIAEKTDYPDGVLATAIVDTKETIMYCGPDGVSQSEVRVVKLDTYLHFKKDAFEESAPVE
jgi:hypothetical protein